MHRHTQATDRFFRWTRLKQNVFSEFRTRTKQCTSTIQPTWMVTRCEKQQQQLSNTRQWAESRHTHVPYGIEIFLLFFFVRCCCFHYCCVPYVECIHVRLCIRYSKREENKNNRPISITHTMRSPYGGCVCHCMRECVCVFENENKIWIEQFQLNSSPSPSSLLLHTR